jgi:MFS family permease
LCAAATSIGFLVAARALQGVGGALLTPGSLAMISASFVPDDRGKAIGAWSGFSGVATAVGPFLGGYLVSGPGWRWIFLINVPLALVVVAVSLRHVPETRDPEAARRIDVAGAALGAAGLAGLTYALIDLGRGWSAGVAAAGAVGIAALVTFVRAERGSRHPMLPTEIFRSRQFSATNVVTFLVYGALGGLAFLLVVALQVAAGFSPTLAGAALVPVTVLMLLFSARAGDLSARIGPRLPMSAGPLVAAAGALLLLRVGRHASYPSAVLPGVLIFGAGLTLLVAPLTTTVLAAAETRRAGIASGVNNAVARAASLLAVAVLPVAAGIHGDDYRHPERFLHGFHVGLVICAALLVAGGLTSAALIRNPARAERTATREHAPGEAGRRTECPFSAPPLQVRD